MVRNERSEEDDAAASVRLLCHFDGGLCPAVRVRACADARALPQLVSEPGLRTRGLFILKCFVKWKEVWEKVPSLLLSQLGIVSKGVTWFEEERVICLKMLPN